MRSSFAAATVSCVVALFAIAVTDWSLPSIVVAVAALGLMALWLAHIVAFAFRATHRFVAEGEDEIAAESDRVSSRRRALLDFTQALAFAAAITSLPLPMAAALAQNNPPLCVRQNCQTLRRNACVQCCACQEQACTQNVNTCVQIWQNCNGACSYRPL